MTTPSPFHQNRLDFISLLRSGRYIHRIGHVVSFHDATKGTICACAVHAWLHHHNLARNDYKRFREDLDISAGYIMSLNDRAPDYTYVINFVESLLTNNLPDPDPSSPI